MQAFNWDHYQKKIEWFREARFGMFIHWGLYAIPARGEWVRSNERMSVELYQPYFDQFTADLFDAKCWAKAAKQAGMKYAVFTAKHHDGFCLFDSQYTDYKSTNTPFGRDAVQEFLEAFREEGIKVGLYYSLLDWHHPDYPHYGDPHHPMRENLEYKGKPHDFDRYLEYMHAQVKELATNYGKIDIFWFDFAYENLRGEAWRGSELIQMVRQTQPWAIFDNRLEASGEGFGSLLSENPQITSGDFVSPEQIIPPHGIRNARGEVAMWESCITMNHHWGYAHNDSDFKSSSVLIRKLVECVSKNGNLRLNIGPDARGRFPQESLKILSEIGQWMKKNSESIYGCGSSHLEKPEYGRITAKDRCLYFHITEAPIGFVPLIGLKIDQIESIVLLADHSEISIAKNWITGNYQDIVFISLGDRPELPNIVDTVVKVRLKT